jgi:uncharacterized repeat protein (TIGR01451 family)
LAITKTGPKARYVDRPAIWEITVNNPGAVPLANVIVRDQLPPELAFTSASDGGQPVQGAVVWNLGTLQPRDQKVVHVTTRCLRIAPRVVNVAVATADPGLQVQAEAPVEIRGLPAFRLEVVDTDDPVEVGSRTTYRIDVTNQGSLPGNQIEIMALVPAEMKIINVNGPSTPRIEGQRITFAPVDSLAPQQMLRYTVEVEALRPGDVRFRAELRSSTLSGPVIEEESTNVYAPVPGAGPAPSTPPPAGAAGPPPGPAPGPLPPVGPPAPLSGVPG